jgi:hypothetical protein
MKNKTLTCPLNMDSFTIDELIKFKNDLIE